MGTKLFYSFYRRNSTYSNTTGWKADLHLTDKASVRLYLKPYCLPPSLSIGPLRDELQLHI